MRPRSLVVLLALALGALLPATAFAVGPNQKRDGRATFDVNATAATRGKIAAPPKSRDAAADALRRSLGTQGQVAFDRVTGTPRSVAKLDGFLTGPSAAAPATIALGYVKARAEVFGLDAGDLAGLKLVKDYKDVLGTHHLVWAQVVDGIPTIENGLRAAVAKGGQLVNVQGAPIPDLTLPTRSPGLSAVQALDAARGDAGVRGPRPAVQQAAGGPRRLTDFTGDNQARLGIYMTFKGPQLAWSVIADKSSDQLYDYVIDASSGQVLRRQNTVDFATGLAWDYFPGPLPPNNSGVATSRDFTAKGWLASNATTLSGSNAHTYFDVADDNTPAAGDEVPPSSGSNWNYALQRFNDDSFFQNCSVNFPCSWDSSTAFSWQTNARQNATQIFYFVNNFHDWLKANPIGFTEAAGNFQTTNPTGQGVGGDAVQAQALDGANTAAGFPDNNHFNNANMGTLRDGLPPRMQMYLMSGAGPNGGDTNSGDDASVIYHEYTHGLSSRLVTDNDGNPALGAQQSGSMGEGWSDWYAMDYLVHQGFDADTAQVGDVNVAFYTAGGEGFRTEPTDCPVSNTSVCQNFNGAGDGGYTYADFGKVLGAPEVHADGEIWTQTLWEIRQGLIAKYGAAAGDARAETYFTRGMEFTPPRPSMIDARNGILQAETVATAAGGPYAGSNDDDVLWGVFARRGMGYYAAALDGNDVNPVANFSQPPAPGAPHGTLTGKVSLQDGGAPATGARVEIGGHNSGLGSDLAGTTNASGTYTISGVPNGTYPYVFVGGSGYDRIVTSNVTVNGTTTRNFTVRRNWAQKDGGGAISSFSAPDLSGNGCGPNGAIDGSQASGWGSTSPSSTQGPGGAKQITVKLPQTVNLTQYAVDPGATCGDDDNASVGSYTIATSTNGTTFTQTNTGTFSATNNHKLNLLTPTTGKTGVRYVRFTMNTPQANTGSGKDWMDMSEFKVYGTAVTPTSTARSDFNGDGYPDLAVGAPGEDVGSKADAGMVNVLYGSSAGLAGTGAQGWTQDSTAVVGTANGGERFGAALATGDFNNDGYDDLAVGAPGDAAGTVANAGTVTVLYGSSAGLTGTGSKQLRQGGDGITGDAEAGDAFGATLASANFGNNGQADLAIGVPGENTGAGVVQLVYGSPTGLTSAANKAFSQTGAGGNAEAGDRFGASLSAGDLGKTSTADLAVGAPHEATGAATNSGAVSVLYGTAGGISPTDAVTLTQDSTGVQGGNAVNDQLGAALAIGNLSGSATADLAVGMPGKDVHTADQAGRVLVLPGSATGVATTGTYTRDEDSPGVPDTEETGDHFGATLAADDVAGDTRADLVVGSPDESVGSVAGAGQATVLLGSTGAELSTTGATSWNQNTAGILESADANDHLGASLALGRWSGAAKAGLAFGIPGEDVGTVVDAGAIAVLSGGSTVTATGNQYLHQRSTGVPDDIETGDGFGAALSRDG